MSLLLACIGQDPINGYSRFTFGNHNLIGGLSLVPVLIGVFSLPEVFNLVEELARSRGHEHQQERIQVGSMRVSPKTMLSHAATIIKSSVIGVIIGIIPAASADVAAFLAYNESSGPQASRDLHPRRGGRPYGI